MCTYLIWRRVDWGIENVISTCVFVCLYISMLKVDNSSDMKRTMSGKMKNKKNVMMVLNTMEKYGVAQCDLKLSM